MNVIVEPNGDDQIDVAVYAGIDPLGEDPDVGELGPFVARLTIWRSPSATPFPELDRQVTFQAALRAPAVEPLNLDIAVPRFVDTVVREVEA